MNVALIVFGGRGERITSPVPKQFIKIKEKELVVYTIEAFNIHPLIDEIVLVCAPEYLGYVKNMIYMNRLNKVNYIIAGGVDRQESVRNGLNGIKLKDDDIVLIHDGDRPFITSQLITKCLDNVKVTGAVAPYIKHTEALEEISNSGRFFFEGEERFDVQTPQGFYFKSIKEIHNRLKDEKVSDDVSLYEFLDMKTHYIPGDKENFKVTTNEDLAFAKSKILGKKDE